MNREHLNWLGAILVGIETRYFNVLASRCAEIIHLCNIFYDRLKCILLFGSGYSFCYVGTFLNLMIS